MATEEAKPQPNIDRQTLVSLLLGITVWFVHLNTINALTSVACKWRWLASSTLAGVSGLRWLDLLVTLAALALLILLIYRAWRIWRSYQTRKPADSPRLLEDTEKDRRPLGAFIAMMLNGFFLLIVIAMFVPMLTLKACGQV